MLQRIEMPFKQIQSFSDYEFFSLLIIIITNAKIIQQFIKKIIFAN